MDDPGGVMSDGCVSVQAAVQFSGLSRTALYRLMTAGQLQYTQVGVRRLIPRAALKAMLAAGLKGGADAAGKAVRS